MKRHVTPIIAFLLPIVFAYFWWLENRDLTTAKYELQALREQISELQAAAAAARDARISEADVKRLQEEQLELQKLRGQVNNLKRAVTDAEKARDAAQRSATASKAPASEAPFLNIDTNNPAARIMRSKVSARIPSGHALALGGWESSPGKRAFAFVLPRIENESGSVVVETKWVEVTDEVAQKIRLDGILSKSGSQSAAFTPEQYKFAHKTFEETAGVDFLSSPRIITTTGQAASVSITESRPTPLGEVHFGPQMTVIPRITPEGALDLDVDATYTVATEEPTKPE